MEEIRALERALDTGARQSEIRVAIARLLIQQIEARTHALGHRAKMHFDMAIAFLARDALRLSLARMRLALLAQGSVLAATAHALPAVVAERHAADLLQQARALLDDALRYSGN